MFALLLCALLVLASAWMLASDSSAAALLVYLTSAVAVALKLALLAASRQRVPRSLIWSLLLAGMPVAWYFANALGEGMPAASRRHLAEITGAVLPGLVLGVAAAMAVAGRLRETSADQRAAQDLQLRRFLALDGLLVAGVAGYLLMNTGEGILLISTALLAGAETYQTLGDALTVNLALAWMLSSLGVADHGALQRPRWLVAFGLPLVTVATLACAVLAGSNKLLLVAVAFGSLMLWKGGRRWAAQTQHLALVLLLAAAVLVAAGAWLLQTDTMNELLALTRLLDYGNVDSILDTPSIASRLEILDGCAGQQFALGPLAGDLAAEFKTCGDGHYLHSLMSIQTHLGLVGTCLFLVPLLRAVYLVRARADYEPVGPVLTILLLTGLVAAHFTWMPFWFVMGLVAGLYGEANRSSAQTCDSISHGPALRA
jgi:hypothetical protein